MACAEDDCDHDWHYDAPRSFRGRMQRGLGYGAYRARLDPTGAQIVNECLRRDYRWDWQVDDRIVYLARLVRDVRLDITPLVDQMRACGPRKPYGEPDPTDDDNQFDVAVGVLTALARTGNGHARDAVRDYVTDGARWLDVTQQIGHEWPDAWWEDLWVIAARRIQPDDAHTVFADSGPWPTWSGRDPCIDAVLDAAKHRIEQLYAGRCTPDLEQLTTGELVAVLGTAAVHRQHKVAVLAQLRRREPAPELLDLADRIEELNLPFLGSALRRLGPMAITSARTWAAQPGHPLAWTGQQILADHGDRTDIPALLTALQQLDAGAGWCGYDTITQGLTRIATASNVSASAVKDQLIGVLRRLLHTSPHSFERASYLSSLLALDPDRTERLLPLCLLDCEPQVRLLAARYTPMTDDAQQWLAGLGQDPLEEDAVREAAGQRIHAATR